jgi:3-deoxy-D-manno-octulosonic-acid transferase
MKARFKPSLKHRIALLSYTVVMALISPLLILHTAIKLLLKSEGYTRRKLERFGVISGEFQPNGLWVHCVSVGEVVAAALVIEKLLAEDPKRVITVTTTTPTGSQRVVQLFGDRVQHCYLPYDFSLFVHLSLTKIKPKALLITEVELWPTLIHQCWKKGIPSLVINARMTDRSAKGYQKVASLFTPMLHKLSLVCAQGQRDYDNYKKLGICATKVQLTNNIKFDIAIPQQEVEHLTLIQKYNPNGKTVILAGSTHDPEENLMLEAFEACKANYSDLLLLIVPRHPQRFDIVYKRCLQSSLKTCRASQSVDPDADIILVDEMGVLSRLYQIAQVAFVGGSIAPRGGHNALEAAACAVPVMMGSSRHNNPDICLALEQAGAITTVNTMTDIEKTLSHWLLAPQNAKAAGEKGKQAIDNNAGAVDNTMAAVDQFVR